jgi:hypothetical protein
MPHVSTQFGKRHRVGRVRWIVVVLLLLLLCIGGCVYRVVDVVWFSPKIRISPETTVVTGPLRPDGSVDYFAVINERMSEGVTPENNAAVLLVQAIGPGALEGTADEVYYRLGLALPPPEAPRLIDSNEFGRVGAPLGQMGPVDAHLTETMSRAWTRDEFPQSAAWIDANAAALDLVVEATQRERFYVPVVPSPTAPGLVGAALPVQQRSRAIARVLASRAMFRLGAGDLGDAEADLVACHRLASLVGQSPFLISDLVAIAIDAVAAQGDAALLSDARLTAEQARRMLEEHRKLPPLPDVAQTIDGDERFQMIDSTCGLMRAGTGAAPVPMLGVDGNVMLRSMNGTYDRAAEALRIDDYSQRTAELATLEKDVQARAGKKSPATLMLSSLIGSRAASSRMSADALLALLAPSIVTAQTAEDRAAARRRLLVIGCALAVYRAEQGESPANLKALTPALLEEVPLDPFGDQPFIYRSTGEGGFRLYSVGQNLKDDGGATPESEPKGDDVLLTVPVHR